MNLLRAVGLVAAVALLFAGFTLVREAAPHPREHERVLTSLLRAFLDDAALQRDVLQARAGLLRSYDPLNERIGSLRRIASELWNTRNIPDRDAALAIKRAADELVSALDTRGDVLERFKTRNALVQNSIQIFTHSIERLTRDVSDPALAADLGAASIAMLRFVNDPAQYRQEEVDSILARLKARVSTDTDQRALLAHGALLLASLPVVERLAMELQTTFVSDHIRALRGEYLHARRLMEVRARWMQRGLYAGALMLAAYVAALLFRLRRQAEALKRRVALEHATAAISSHFVALPSERASHGMAPALTLLARYTGAEEVHVVTADEHGEVLLAGHWPEKSTEPCPHELLARAEVSVRVFADPGAAEPPKGLIGRLAGWRRKRRRGDSWSAFPLGGLEESRGYVLFKSPPHMAGWAEQDRLALGMAAEIFGMALRRARGEEERQDLELRLSQAQRLESLGTLAGGIAHEFNNILGGMLGHAEMAQLALRKDPAVRRHLEHIIRGGSRAQAVINNVLAFGRQRERTAERLDAAAVAQEALDLLRASLPDTIILRPMLAQGIAVAGDATEFQQVLLNLCTNAAHAMDGVGMITVRLTVEEIGADRSLSHGHLGRGRFVCLEVADGGPGIPPATMRRMFEPFFSTKPVGSGTGLGLSTVHGIVTAWSGGIHVVSRPGTGTKVQVFLPEAADGQTGTLDGMPRRGLGQTVLLVRALQKDLLLDEEILAALGYEPVGYESAGGALAALEADPHRFQAALLEHLPPALDALPIAGELIQRCPGLAVILLAGPDTLLDLARVRRAGVADVMRKPVRSRDFAECLARHLSKPNSAELSAPESGKAA